VIHNRDGRVEEMIHFKEISKHGNRCTHTPTIVHISLLMQCTILKAVYIAHMPEGYSVMFASLTPVSQHTSIILVSMSGISSFAGSPMFVVLTD
jgi:hypothetical protein